MNNIRNFLEILNESEEEISFNKDELTPVIIQNPGKKGKSSGGEMPDPIDGEKIEVEVINVNTPQSGDSKGKSNDKVKIKDSDLSNKQSKVEKNKQTVGGEEKDDTGKNAGKISGGRRNTFDSHDILDKSQKGEATQITKEILEKAKETRERKGENEKESSNFGTGDAMEKIRNLYEPKIDWLRELKKKIMEFKSESAANINRLSKVPSKKMKSGVGKQKEKSFITGLYHPGSHVPGQKIVFKGPFKKAPYGELVLIVALDVSGSIGKSTLEKVFSEMDKIAQNFKMGISLGGRKFQGKVYFMTWDTQITGVSEYKAGDWKKYVNGEDSVKGGGGTDPTSIFNYIHDHLIYNKDEEVHKALLNLIKKPTETGISDDDIILEFVSKSNINNDKLGFTPVSDEKESKEKEIKKQDNYEKDKGEMVPIAVPFLLIATDGEFGQSPSENNLGLLYKNHHNSILYLIIDGTTKLVHPKNVIEYESYKI